MPNLIIINYKSLIMPRPVWSGTIAFGLVNIPVKMYGAVSEATLDLDMLDKKDHSHIKYKRVNEKTGREVAWKDIVKGYKVEGKYVVLEDKDFERAAAEKTKRIDIISFVHEEEIDSIYFETGYFLEPEAKDEKPYALLREAMKKSGMVGLGKYVMRNREHLCVIKVYDNALLLNKLHFAEEINNPADYKIPRSVKLNTAEVKMAVSLIDSMSAPFDISGYKDEYAAQLMKFIRAKAKGKLVTPKAAPKKMPDDVSSLLEQLKASLRQPAPRKTKAASSRKATARRSTATGTRTKLKR